MNQPKISLFSSSLVDKILQYRKQIVLVVLAFGVLSIAFVIWKNYQVKKSLEIGLLVNEQVRKSLEIDFDKKNSLLQKELVEEIKKSYLKIYEENPFFKAAGRALFLCANLEYFSGNEKQAALLYEKLFTKNKRHPSSPNALYFAAVLVQKGGENEKALDFLNKFESSYRSHYLLGEVMLEKARLQSASGKYEEAALTYEAIMNNQDLSFYVEKAIRGIRLLSVKGVLGREGTDILRSLTEEDAFNLNQ